MTHNLFAPLSPLNWYQRSKALSVALCCCAMVAAAPAQASTAKEKVFCTNKPPSQWISEAQARERFHASDYVLVQHKISSGNCHEFYAVDAQGAVVESYLHPITGDTVRSTRIPAPTPAKP